MTSSNSPENKGDQQLPMSVTLYSSKISLQSSQDADLEQLKSQVHLAEEKMLQSVLSYLECLSSPSFTFGEILSFQSMHKCRSFYVHNGVNYYIPNSISDNRLLEAATALKHNSLDTGEVRRALYEIWLTTKHRKMEEADRDAMLMVYTQKLSHYPKETVVLVLKELSDHAPFFPAWSEIKEKVDEYGGQRLALLNSLRNVYKKRIKDAKHDLGT